MTVDALRPADSTPVLEVEGLAVTFRSETDVVPAVRGVDLCVGAGETLALVGESGSGKSTSVLAMLGLIRADLAEVHADSVRFEGRTMSVRGRDALRTLLGRRIGVIFQDPQSSLNPTMRIGAQVTETLRVHEGLSRRVARTRAVEALDEVGVPDPEWCASAYPHQLSGGMRQRVMIAMATVGNPALLIADEPTTALDVTLQAQIVDLLLERQRTHGTAIVFITHDLSLVSGFADRTQVMYAGQVVEHNDGNAVVTDPVHPYTRALVQSVPTIGGDPVRPIPGRPPDPRQLPDGCAFSPRCAHSSDRCGTAPDLIVLPSGVASRCWLATEETAHAS
ncbi:MAG: ABC transporter ATP-binding protein [Acidimicrobiales bacterium]